MRAAAVRMYLPSPRGFFGTGDTENVAAGREDGSSLDCVDTVRWGIVNNAGRVSRALG
jgi:hypothetical protein